MVTDAITSHTTHVVAAKKGTVKVNQAKKTPGIFIVSPEWLHVCSTLWGRAAEDDFILEPNAVSTAAPKLFVRVNSSSSDNLQVDEQDFAILSGVYDQSLSAHFGSQDWLEMDREVEEAMNEDDDFDDDEDRDDEHDSLDDEIEEGLDELLSGEDVVPMSGLSADETSQKRKRAVADDSLDPPKDTAKR